MADFHLNTDIQERYRTLPPSSADVIYGGPLIQSVAPVIFKAVGATFHHDGYPLIGVAGQLNFTAGMKAYNFFLHRSAPLATPNMEFGR